MDKILARLQGVRQCGDSWKALCPAHPDLRPSLSIGVGESGDIVLRCHAGCKTEAVLEGLGLTWADLRGDGTSSGSKRRAETTDEDRELRDTVYRGLLARLTLSYFDREHLRSRGLRDGQIEANEYRSLVFPETTRAAVQLHDLHGEALFRVPGFCRKGGSPALSQNEGLIIPVRDPRGRIVALQVRTGDSGRKYVWFSSPEARSGSPVHVPVGVKLGDGVRITEGPLKADVAFALSGIPTVGVASVSAWQGMIPELKQHKVSSVEIAFDADWKTKPPVREQLEAFRRALRKEGISSTVLTWDDTHKGLDEALSAGVSVSCVTTQAKEEVDDDLEDLVVHHMVDVAPRTVEWLWTGWVPFGAVTVLDGDPGLGKSTLTCELAAAVSTGRSLPGGGPTEAGDVLILSAEDDVARTLVPRLHAARANPSRIHFWAAVRPGGNGLAALPALPDDVDKLDRLVRKYRVKLVVIDPIYAYFSGQVDAFKDQHVRRVLSAVANVASNSQAAVVAVRHLNKDGNKSALYRGGGSVAVIGQARSGLFFVADPEKANVRHLFHYKCNLARLQKPLRVVLEQDGEHARLSWAGESEYGLEELLRSRSTRSGNTEAAARRQWLLGELTRRGPTPLTTLLKEAAEFGWNREDLKNARRSLLIRSERDPETGDQVWLPPVHPRALETEDGQSKQTEGKSPRETNGRHAPTNRGKSKPCTAQR